MSEYSRLVSLFSERYEDPEVEPYIVGFSGIDPDKKINPSVIPHDELYGLLGGDVTGRYHLTSNQAADVKALPGKITSIESDISANKREAAENLSINTQNLQSQITANKSSADSDISNVKSRMSGLETRQVEYEGNITSQFTETKSAVKQGLDDFFETKDAINARIDYLLENSTDSMEILDARTDAKNVTYPYLGKNIRSIHGEVLSQQGQIDTLKEGQHEINDRQAECRTDIDFLIKTRKSDVQELQSAIDAEAGRIDKEISERSKAILNEQTTRERALIIEAEIRNQADIDERNARIQAITDEKKARKDADLQERNERVDADETELKFRVDKDNHLQEQADTLSDLAIIEAIRHYKNMCEIKALMSGEKSERIAEDEAIREDIDIKLSHVESKEEHLQSQIDDLAESSQVTSLSIYKEAQTRKETLTHFAGNQTERADFLQGQTDDLAGGLVKVIAEVYRQYNNNKAILQRELSRRDEEFDRLREMIRDLTDAILLLVKTVHDTNNNEELAARLTVIENALIEDGELSPSDNPVTTDEEISERLDAILNP